MLDCLIACPMPIQPACLVRQPTLAFGDVLAAAGTAPFLFQLLPTVCVPIAITITWNPNQLYSIISVTSYGSFNGALLELQTPQPTCIPNLLHARTNNGAHCTCAGCSVEDCVVCSSQFWCGQCMDGYFVDPTTGTCLIRELGSTSSTPRIDMHSGCYTSSVPSSSSSSPCIHAINIINSHHP